ncbi:UxaA family hydrolase [Cellulomonas sp. Y8]|uniref:UxaA family hydrolase n=1 Tax=Cellulomonas sp. Y8 TaxID=2591145 RepID=UPI0035273FCA
MNCSASTARMIADAFPASALAAFPHVDGVLPLTHQSGCGMVPESEGGRLLLRTLRGYAAHPNVGAVLVLGLGCEMLQPEQLSARDGAGAFLGMPSVGAPAPEPAGGGLLATIPDGTVVRSLTIQDTGGVRATVRAGVEAVRRCCRSSTGAGARRSTSGSSCWASTAAGPTGTRGSPRTRRSAGPATGSSPTAGRRRSPRRPRCSGRSTC